MIGTTISHYHIISKLGQGGMGEVYLAEDTKLDRKVALKLLPDEVASDQERMRRFVQEAKSASALNHPNIITIYEIGEIESRHFIATEFINGETLRKRMRHGHMKLGDILEIAIQTTGALAAAHAAGIIHRDIKPENIMARPDGYIKVLDFGLAKLTEPQGFTADTEAPTKTRVDTGAGVVLGTLVYMSPEQAKGQRLDVRTDLWSLGAVMYEMVTGHAPFEAETPSEVLGLILNKEPALLARFERDAPPELERIVSKALTKNLEERYQTAKDILVDLKRLKRHLDLESEIERTVPPSLRTSGISAAHVPADSTATGQTVATMSGTAELTHQISSAQYIATEIKKHKKGFAVSAAVVFAVALTIVGYFVFARRTVALTDKDTILISDFVNTTGDGVFDGTLKQGLVVQLGQSPYLSLFPDARVRQTLRMMGHSPDDRVTQDIAREICQRQGLKALITGSIAALGSHYVLTLTAVNSQSGEVVASEQSEAENKEEVLKALTQAANKLREKLGESLNSIQRFDAPLEATTSSLEALKAYTLASDQASRGKWLEAVDLYKHALELDPNFASGYSGLAVCYANTYQPKLAAENMTKAYALRDRVSEVEKFRITAFYYFDTTGEFDKYIETLELYKQTYPRDDRPYINLSVAYDRIGQWEKSAQEAAEAIRMNPNTVAPHSNLARAYMRLNRYDESLAVLDRAFHELKLDSEPLHAFTYYNAAIRGDAATMKREVDGLSGKPNEYTAVDWQTNSAYFAGQWHQMQDFSRRAIDLAAHSNAKAVAAQYAAEAALHAAVLGKCAESKSAAAQALSFERNQVSLTRSSVALALCGDVGQAQALVDELVKEYPQFTIVNGIWLPTIRAALELDRNNAAQALTDLEPATRYEAAGEYWPQYLRGQAYLKLNKGAEAAVEFRKIIGARGQAPLSALFPLAHVGLARAAMLQGDSATARNAYQDFFTFWKDADPDISILIEAKKEYEKVK
ncbi:MAG TPA: protein kinase [Pyrinomonadaceae bacterium]|jgi:Serine/threonine protein kinase|nr:protein kinase [Pyrinomonadaceae bacterium]